MAKFKRVILTVLCVLFLLSFSGFVIYRDQQYQQYKTHVFGHSFGTSLNLYSNAMVNYAWFVPSYGISDDGILYMQDYTTSDDDIRQVGKLIPFQLSENNFDLCIEGAGWCANGVDAAFIRSHTLSSWKCVAEDGALYYLILQENGDVFLAMGQNGDTISIYEIVCLSDLGNEEVFTKAYSE